jgi:hypothetical protein
MAEQSNTNRERHCLLHVGFMVPLRELMLDNPVLQRELGHLNLRSNVYSATLFYKDTNQDTLYSWFEQRKRSHRTGYLRAYFMSKRQDAVIEMDVDGKQLYLIAAATTSKSPLQMKQDIAKGLFGERIPFSERIQVLSFPYKCDTKTGFTECEAFVTFKNEYEKKKDASNATNACNGTVS